MRFPIKSVMILSLASTLMVGCATREEALYGYQKNCLDYGFVYGTDEFSRCMLDQERLTQKERLHNQRMAHKRVARDARSGHDSSIYQYQKNKNYYNYQSVNQKKNSWSNKAYDNLPTLPATNPFLNSQKDRNDLRYKPLEYGRFERDLQKKQKAAREEQVHRDAELARKLQAEEDARYAHQREQSRQEQSRKDAELARKLQAEEDARYAHQQEQARREQSHKDAELARKLQAEEKARFARQQEQSRKDAELARKLQAEEKARFARQREQSRKDAELARKLQAEEKARFARQREQSRKDAELARRLQAEEDGRYARQQEQARREQSRKDAELAHKLQSEENARAAHSSSIPIPPSPPPISSSPVSPSSRSFAEELAVKVAERQARLDQSSSSY